MVEKVASLTTDLERALEAVGTLAEFSESRFESVDDQVVHLRGSTGSRPKLLGPNLPGLDLWTNISKLADDVVDAREEATRESKPSSYEETTRSIAEGTKKTIKKIGLAVNSLDNVKAEYTGQVKPLEAGLSAVVTDLYAPKGSYNKVLMNGISGENGSSSARHQA
jgi:hypothetical protein